MNENSREQLYEWISFIAYPVFLFTAVIAQIILFIFLFFFTPSYINCLRILLFKTSVLHFFAAAALFYIQPRIIAGVGVNVPVYCYGACRHLSPRVCFALYMTWQTMSLSVAASLLYTLYYKFYKITVSRPLSYLRIGVSLFIAYVPCFVSTICAIIIVLRNTLPDEPVKKRGDSEDEMEDLGYMIMGRMRLGEIPNRINFAMISIGVYTCPIIAFWFQWKTRKSMREKMFGASPILQYHAKSVMVGLTLQVILHFLCYVPLFSLYLYSIVTGEQILFQQFFLTMSPNLTASIDPFINLYYVVPYRNRIKSWLIRRNQGQGAISVVPSV